MLTFIVIILLIVAIGATRIICVRREKNRLRTHPLVHYIVRIDRKSEKTPRVAEFVFASLHSTVVRTTPLSWILGRESPTFSYEVRAQGGRIAFHITAPAEHGDLVVDQLYAQYPDIEIDRIEDYVELSIRPATVAVGVDMITKNAYVYPIRRHPQFEEKITKSFADPLSGLLAGVTGLSSDEEVWISLLLQPIGSDRWQKRGIWMGGLILRGIHPRFPRIFMRTVPRYWFFRYVISPFLVLVGYTGYTQGLKDEVDASHDRETTEQAIRGKISQIGFHADIRIVALSHSGHRHLAEKRLRHAVGAFSQFEISRFNVFTTFPIKGDRDRIVETYRSRLLTRSCILAVEEVATLWHMPNITVLTPGIESVVARRFESPLNLPTAANTPPETFVALGKTDYRSRLETFGIRTEDRRRHLYVVGKTGMGKSTFLENMIVSDIEWKRGLAVIDPHGDLVDAVSKFIPKGRTNDTVIFDPSDTDFPISFNLLECRTPEARYLVASGIVGVMKKMFENSWWPRLEYILRNTILALTEIPEATIISLMKVLANAEYRDRIVQRVQDPIVRSFWLDEFASWAPNTRAEAVSPIQNKVGQLLSSPIVRNIFGQPKSSVDLRFFMDREKIILINLSKGKLGEDNASVLGSLLITKFQIDAMSRSSIPEAERKDFFLYIDEFQNFATDSFATILSEARKYRLNLTMANQYLEQMTDIVRAAVFGNVGSMVAFQTGAEDAEVLMEQFADGITNEDIAHLPKYRCYVRLMIEGVNSRVFSAQTLPPPVHQEGVNYALRENLITVSREKYAKTKATVENRIQEWMGGAPKEKDESAPPKDSFSKSSSSPRKDDAKGGWWSVSPPPRRDDTKGWSSSPSPRRDESKESPKPPRKPQNPLSQAEDDHRREDGEGGRRDRRR